MIPMRVNKLTNTSVSSLEYKELDMRELHKRIKKIEQLQKGLGGNTEIVIVLINADGQYYKKDAPKLTFKSQEEIQQYYKASKPSKDFIFIIDTWM